MHKKKIQRFLTFLSRLSPPLRLRRSFGLLCVLNSCMSRSSLNSRLLSASLRDSSQQANSHLYDEEQVDETNIHSSWHRDLAVRTTSTESCTKYPFTSRAYFFLAWLFGFTHHASPDSAFGNGRAPFLTTPYFIFVTF